jgi:outer membrane receptor protein involved in Fe transport
MKPNPKIAAAVAAILSAPSTAIVFAADTAPATATGGELTEVVVTAERRTENLQDVPITVQAITGDQLKQLSVVSFYDLLKYTPNVTYSGNGPGTGNMYMRGLGGTGSGNQSQSTTAPFPNVALYLDDQSMQFPARNNDVYLVDMERVEVLEGPQGTLFGGGAQAGAIRYITNKPKFDAVSGEANFGYGTTAHGDQNSVLNATLNFPVNDFLALRGVIFSEHRGGYIDNVPSTISYYPGTLPTTTPTSNPIANNGAVAGTATNPVTYTGARLSAAMKFNDSWDLLLQQNYQDMQADGYFYTYPATGYNGVPLQPYQITAFTPAYTKDKYESTAWTLNGKISDLLSMVYTGSYMVRKIDGQQDYSNYTRSAYGNSYACIGANAGFFNAAHFPVLAGKPLQCASPVGSWRDQVNNTHQSHELRFSTNADYRLRGLAGFYWEKFIIDDNMNFNYLGVPECTAANLAIEQAGGPDCVTAVGPLPGTYASDPSLRTDANTAFGEDDQRGYRQKAGFVSVDFDLIPKVLTLTGGVRFYHYDEFEHGSEYATERKTPSVVDTLDGTCTAAGGCGFPMDLDKSEGGHRFRGNLTWHIAPDLMAYYTYSEGFRPGGFNRTSSLNGIPSLAAEISFCNPKLPTCINQDQYEKPAGFQSDNLINNEIGLKSEFLDHRLLVNVSAYYMKWNNVQLSLFNPSYFGNTTFNVNGPDFVVKGFEVQFVARITDELSVQGSSSVNSSRQSNSPCIQSVGVDPNNVNTANNPTPAGACITTIAGVTVPNQLGAHDTPPAFSPPWMFNLRARYDWSAAGNARPFAWVGASHVGPMTNEPRNFFSGSDPTQSNPPTTTMLLYDIPGYTTYDAAIGVVKDNWTAQITGSNLSNEYGPTNISSGQFIKSEIPLRPRVLMAQFSVRF